MYDYKSEKEIMACVLGILKDISEDVKSRSDYFSAETEKLVDACRKAYNELDNASDGCDTDNLKAYISNTYDKIRELQDERTFCLGEQDCVLNIQKRLIDFYDLYFAEPTSLC